MPSRTFQLAPFNIKLPKKYSSKEKHLKELYEVSKPTKDRVFEIKEFMIKIPPEEEVLVIFDRIKKTLTVITNPDLDEFDLSNTVIIDHVWDNNGDAFFRFRGTEKSLSIPSSNKALPDSFLPELTRLIISMQSPYRFRWKFTLPKKIDQKLASRTLLAKGQFRRCITTFEFIS